jgi:hypothetical protein
MHRYLHNYEDFLLIDEDYGARIGSRRQAFGPKSRLRRRYSEDENGNPGPKGRPRRRHPESNDGYDFEDYDDDFDDFDYEEDGYDSR